MAQSSVSLQNDGTIGLVLRNQTELSSEEKEKLAELERTAGLLSKAESMLKKEIELAELKLLDNPDYQYLVKMRGKLKISREMIRRNKVILDNEYQKVFEGQGLEHVALDLLANSLPDPRPAGRRGRPRLAERRA